LIPAIAELKIADAPSEDLLLGTESIAEAVLLTENVGN
jgi:hypothetical protein